MGQKINPQSLRLGIVKDWSSRWYFSSLPEKEGGKQTLLSRKALMKKLLEEDEAVRATIMEKIAPAGISAIDIERTLNDVKIIIKAARPGLVIGRGGKGIEELSEALIKALRRLRGKNYKTHLSVNVEELKRSEIAAAHIAQQISWDIEKRLPYRRAIKKQMDQISQNREAKGAKILLSGRLGGAEIARREVLRWGALPLQTLRADIDYGTAVAKTTYGTIGIKVWVYRGEKLGRLHAEKPGARSQFADEFDRATAAKNRNPRNGARA